MTTHNVVHLSDIFRSILLLLSNSMVFELFDELGLVVLVNVRDLLCGQLIFSLALDPPVDNLISVGEPDRIIVVLEELTLHAQNFDVM